MSEPQSRLASIDFALADDIEVAVVDDTIYLLPLFHAPVRLNRTAAAIWRWIVDEQIGSDEAALRYAGVFDCDVIVAKDDIRLLTTHLLDQKFLVARVTSHGPGT